MPWQTAPGIIVIIACFTFTGGMIPVIHHLVKGKPRRAMRDDFDFLMEKRDERLIKEGIPNIGTGKA